MKNIKIVALIGIVAMLALSVGGAGAQGPAPGDETSAIVAAAISYQGRLTDPAGIPLSGTYDLEFTFWSLQGGGVQLGAADTRLAQVITNGLYSAPLKVPLSYVDGRELWLRIRVRETGAGTWEALTPRVQVVPTAYALSLRPGAQIEGSQGVGNAIIMATNTSSGWGLRGESTELSGYGVYGYNGSSSSDAYGGGVIGITETDGYGVRGEAPNGYGVYGSSSDGTGVKGNSSNHIGVYGSTGGDTTNDYGVYGTAGGWGYGVYGRQYNTSGGLGVYGRNDGGGSAVSGYNAGNGNGTWGFSSTYNGVGGGTNRGDNNYGLYTEDNCYAGGYTMLSAVTQVVQNGDTGNLERGDVVVIAGMGKSPAEDVPPIIQVRKSREANSTGVLGVVASTYSAEWLKAGTDPTGATAGGKDIPLAKPGPITPGEYLLVVVQGLAQVKVDAIAGAIQPGDLLSSAGEAGHATRAPTVRIEGVSTAMPGTVLGKALEPLDKGQELIYVFVTLQ